MHAPRAAERDSCKKQGYDFSRRRRRSEEDDICPVNSTALSDTRSVNDERVPKRKETEKFEVESWPQASKFNSWKGSLLREVLS